MPIVLLLLMPISVTMSCELAFAGPSTAASTAPSESLPDGFPAGHSTPEGVACDFARVFISCNASQLTSVCPQLYNPNTPIGKEYDKYRSGFATELLKDAAKSPKASDMPVKIVKCFAARSLSKNGPGSYGYAVLGLAEVMFVDVGVQLADGRVFEKRTLVVKSAKGNWYVHLFPNVDPMLSDGLWKESPSTKLFEKSTSVQGSAPATSTPRR